MIGVEPTCLAAPDPKSGASANFATSAVPETGCKIKDSQANKELKDIEQERGRDYIRLINQMGMSAPESMVNQYGTPEEKPGFIDRTVAFLKGEEAQTFSNIW